MDKKPLVRMTRLFIVTIIVLLLLPQVIKADMGPKPSVVVDFVNLGKQTCYATLLSEKSSTGPYSTWDGKEKTARYKGNPHAEYDFL